MLASYTMASQKLNGETETNKSLTASNDAVNDAGAMNSEGDMTSTVAAATLGMSIDSRVRVGAHESAALKEHIQAGNPVVIGVDYSSAAQGSNFSDADHFLVLTDYDEGSGTFIGQDPLGKENIRFTLDENGV